MEPTELYLRVREKEGRLYPDSIVRRLPHMPPDHPLSTEWHIRADSCRRLKRYLDSLERPLSILEVGCGNGWLAYNLSLNPATHIWGIDRYSSELAQAARVFNTHNLKFLTADIFASPFDSRTFDIVVLASVIQYFPNLPRLIHTLKSLKKTSGEIHLLDSPLYQPEEIPGACQRTCAYYATLGIPEMADHYYHHSLTVLFEFSPDWLYRPESWLARLKRLIGQSVSPFPWLVIR